MTSFVENELYVDGSREDVERFKEEAAGENGCLDMNSFIPYPVQFSKQDEVHRLWIDDAIRKAESRGEVFSDDQKLDFFFRRRFHSEEAPPDGFASGGKEWCCENWGTKWNFCRSTLVFEEDNFLVYEFKLSTILRYQSFSRWGNDFRCLALNSGTLKALLKLTAYWRSKKAKLLGMSMDLISVTGASDLGELCASLII